MAAASAPIHDPTTASHVAPASDSVTTSSARANTPELRNRSPKSRLRIRDGSASASSVAATVAKAQPSPVQTAAAGSRSAISNTGNVQINETTGNLVVGQITTASGSGNKGDVTLTAFGSILAADASSLVKGGAITLTAGSGSIGSLGTNGTADTPGANALALNLQAGSSARDVLNVQQV